MLIFKTRDSEKYKIYRFGQSLIIGPTYIGLMKCFLKAENYHRYDGPATYILDRVYKQLYFCIENELPIQKTGWPASIVADDEFIGSYVVLKDSNNTQEKELEYSEAVNIIEKIIDYYTNFYQIK